MPKTCRSTQGDRNQDRLYTLEGKLIHSTDKAYLFQPKDSDKKIWLPMSQVEYEAGVITLPEWLVIEKELENLVEEV